MKTKSIGELEYDNYSFEVSEHFKHVYYYYDRFQKFHVYIIGRNWYDSDGHVYYSAKYVDINSVVLDMLDNCTFIRWVGGGILKNTKRTW